MSRRIGYRSLTRRERREVRRYAGMGQHHPDAWVAAVCWRWASADATLPLGKGYVVGEVIGGLLAPGSSVIGREVLDRRLARRLRAIGQPPRLLPDDDMDDEK